MFSTRRFLAWLISGVSFVVAGCTASVSDPLPPTDREVLAVTPPDGRVRLLIDPYRISIPPLGPLAPPGERVTVEDGLAGAALGHSIAIDDRTAVAGAPGEQRVYFLVHSEVFWKIAGAIDSPDPDAADFGINVAWDGKHLAVGALGGRAFLYRRVDREWKLIAAVPAERAGAGATTVALPGSDWAVGTGEDVRMFAIGEESVHELGRLRPSAEARGFGRSLATDGDRLLVGAPLEADGGAAYLFVRHVDRVWKLWARFGASTGETDTGFAEAVALTTDVAMIGAPRAGHQQTGRVRVFTDTGVEWKETGVLTGVQPRPKDFFGASIALTPDNAVIGSANDDRRGADAGTVYVFDRAGLYAWSLGEVLSAPDAGAGDRFGTSVATDGRTMAIGAPAWDDAAHATPDTGAVYFF